MKKTLLILSLLIVTSPAFSLTKEDQSTVSKLYSWGVLENQRTENDYYLPMRSIDAMSMQIKTISLISDSFEKDIYYLENRFVKDLGFLQEETTEIKKENDKLKKNLVSFKKESDRKDIGLLILSLISLGFALFK